MSDESRVEVAVSDLVPGRRYRVDFGGPEGAAGWFEGTFTELVWHRFEPGRVAASGAPLTDFIVSVDFDSASISDPGGYFTVYEVDGGS